MYRRRSVPTRKLRSPITVPVCAAILGALLVVLWYPAVFQWLLESLPIPGKARLEGLVLRISHSAAAYRDKKRLVVLALGLSSRRSAESI